MELRRAKIAVPASSANLGPGFDCLALALDLWNEAEFEANDRILVQNEGEGADVLPSDESNLIVRSALDVFRAAGEPPRGFKVTCRNRIPLSSGLGSSAAAILVGLLGGNAMLERPFQEDDLFRMACEKEGHPDNAAAALYGGLAVVLTGANGPEGLIRRKFELPAIDAVLTVPRVDLPTHTARKALPERIAFKDAVFNSSRTPLVVEALRSGDLGLLGQVMQDRLHQPYRLPLIPGAQGAIDAALAKGAAAAALSGAGPSVIAFMEKGSPTGSAVREGMLAAFAAAGIPARGFDLAVSNRGARVEGSSAENAR